MGYVANKEMIVERNGKAVTLKHGDPVPECTTFSTFRALLNTNFIVYMPDEVAAAQAPQALAQHVAESQITQIEAVAKKRGRPRKEAPVAPAAIAQAKPATVSYGDYEVTEL